MTNDPSAGYGQQPAGSDSAAGTGPSANLGSSAPSFGSSPASAAEHGSAAPDLGSPAPHAAGTASANSGYGVDPAAPAGSTAPAGAPPKKKRPIWPWIAGCGCLLVLALVAALIVGIALVKRGGDNEATTTTSSAPTSSAASSDASSSSGSPSSSGDQTGEVPAPPQEVDGYTASASSFDSLYYASSADPSQVIGVDHFPGTSADSAASGLESSQQIGNFTCGTSSGFPACVTDIHGGALMLVDAGSGRTPEQLAAWGEKFLQEWG